MAGRMPWHITAAGADGQKAAPAARPRPGRHLGVLLAVAVLATAGAAGRPGQYTENPCAIDRGATW